MIKKTKLLILGYSDIAQRKILPSLKNHPDIELTAVASKSKFSKIPKGIASFSDYEKAIEDSGADTVYISLYNSIHYPWIIHSLKKGKHVICDKPAVLTKIQAESCLKASKGKLLIF